VRRVSDRTERGRDLTAAGDVLPWTHDDVLRRVLWVSVPANLGAALLFLFPASLGRAAGLPPDVPPLYAAPVAVLVALFGGAYAWLARRPVIDRPLVGLAALGKTGFVIIVFLCWLTNEATGRLLLIAGGDLVFAACFARWLRATASAAPDGRPQRLNAGRARH
jgi:hypothetical protein